MSLSMASGAVHVVDDASDGRAASNPDAVQASETTLQTNDTSGTMTVELNLHPADLCASVYQEQCPVMELLGALEDTLTPTLPLHHLRGVPESTLLKANLKYCRYYASRCSYGDTCEYRHL